MYTQSKEQFSIKLLRQTWMEGHLCSLHVLCHVNGGKIFRILKIRKAKSLNGSLSMSNISFGIWVHKENILTLFPSLTTNLSSSAQRLYHHALCYKWHLPEPPIMCTAKRCECITVYSLQKKAFRFKASLRRLMQTLISVQGLFCNGQGGLAGCLKPPRQKRKWLSSLLKLLPSKITSQRITTNCSMINLNT